MSIECPKCNIRMGMIEIGGKRPGWECRGCGIFFAKQTWEIKDGTLKRKYPTKPKRRGYIDRDALRGIRKDVVGLPTDLPINPYGDEPSADELVDEGWI